MANREGLNKARTVRALVGSLNDNNEFTPAKGETPLPINISGAIGAFVTPWKINWSDIAGTHLTAFSKTENEDLFYDNNLTTYGKLVLGAIQLSTGVVQGQYSIYLNIPVSVRSIIIFAEDITGHLGNITTWYDDGTGDTATLVTAYNAYFNILGKELYVYIYTIPSDKKIVSLTISGADSNGLDGYEGNIHGLYIYVNPNETELDTNEKVNDIDTKMDVNLSQAGQQYLYNSTDGLSAYDRLKDIDNSTQQLITDVETNDINEVKLDPWSTGDVADSLLIANTAKGTTPDVSASYSFPAQDSAGTTLYGTGAVIQIKKFAGRVILNFSNSDTAAAHTAYYEVDLDGVAYTGSVSVPASGTASATIDIEQTDPADGDLTIDIYVWADTANVVTLTSHNIFVGVGTYSTAEDEVIAINREGIQVIATSFDILDATYNYTWVIRSQTSGVRLNYLTNDDLYASDILPKTQINMYVSGSYGYVTGITSIRRVM